MVRQQVTGGRRVARRAVRVGLGVLAAVLVAAGAVPSAAGGAAAEAGSVTQYGTVVFVADGDTIDVRIDGVAPDPGRAGTRIRFLGTQAMELYEYHSDLTRDTGECHAVEAA